MQSALPKEFIITKIVAALRVALALVPKKSKSYAATAAVAAALTSAGFVGTALVNNTPVRHKVQTVYVRNASTYVTNAEVANDMPAFQAAVSQDFAPLWNIDARLVFLGRKVAPSGAIVITLLDKSDVKGALAYHELNPEGVPDSKVFVGTSKYYGYNWTVGFTHELFEMLADPSINRTEQSSISGKIWAAEVADPVEADSLGYTRPAKDGTPVVISDFITDKWFGANTAGPYDFANHITAPEQVLKGGYAQWWDGLSWNVVSDLSKVVHY